MQGYYFRKLLLACLLVVFICGCIAAIHTFVERVHSAEAEWKRNQSLLLEQVRDKVDLTLATAMNAIFNLRSRAELVAYAQSDGKDPYKNTMAFQTLRSYDDVYLGAGFELDIFKTGASTVITKEHTIDMGRYMQALGLDGEGLLDELRSLGKERYMIVVNAEKWSVDTGGKPRKKTHFAVVMNDRRYDQICFMVSIPTSALFPKDLQYNEVFTIKYGGELFASSAPLSEAEPDGLQMYRLPSLKFSDWEYVYHGIMPSFLGIELLQTLVISLLIIAVGAFFAVLIAMRTYRPVRQMIRQLMELVPDKADPLVPKDEFQAIHSIASRMHLENQRLAGRVRELLQPMRANVLRELMLGMLSRDDALRMLKSQQIESLAGQPLSVAIFREADDAGSPKIDRSIVEGIERIVQQCCPDSCVIRLDNHRQAVLLFHEGRESPAEMLQDVINAVHQKYEIRLTVALGSAVPGVLEAVTSYYSAIRVMEQLSPFQRKSLLTAADLEDMSGTEYYYPLELEKELIRSALAQNRNEVGNILDSLLRDSVITAMNSTGYRQFTYSVQSTLHRIVQQLNCGMQDIFEEVPSKALQQCSSLEEVKARLADMVDKVMNVAAEKNKSMDQMLADSMTEFIHQNYHREISLTDLAQHVKLSPSYISTIFKQYIGDNFKDYLNNYRVEQAKRLIAQGEHKVNAIAERVGCHNVNTIIRIFKKAEGVSPGQYIAQKYRVPNEST